MTIQTCSTPHYLLIGNGRLAKHLRHYFSLLDLPFQTWCRQQSAASLSEALKTCTHALVLIRDDAIVPFIQAHLQETQAVLVHCSGSLVTSLAIGAHPLMSFSHDLYTLEQYQVVPFVMDDDAPDFSTVLPGLSNSHARLSKSNKTKYHALSVMSGNFTCLLWQKFFDTLEREFGLPANIARPYLQQQMQNLLTHPQTALTGPLTRGDTQTIASHLQALENDPFYGVYQSFITCYQKMHSEEIS